MYKCYREVSFNLIFDYVVDRNKFQYYPEGKRGNEIWIAESPPVFWRIENSIVHPTKFHRLQYCTFQKADFRQKGSIAISLSGHHHIRTSLISLENSCPYIYIYICFDTLFLVTKNVVRRSESLRTIEFYYYPK